MAAGLISGAYGLAKTVGFNPLKRIGSLFGGGSDCTSAKKQEAQQIAADLQQWTTSTERRNFIISTGSSTSTIPATPSGMAKFYIGGNDCKHKNVAGRHQQFINGLKPFISRMRSEKQSRHQQAADNARKRPAGSGTPAAAGGFTSNLKWIVAAAVALILGYMVTQ